MSRYYHVKLVSELKNGFPHLVVAIVSLLLSRLTIGMFPRELLFCDKWKLWYNESSFLRQVIAICLLLFSNIRIWKHFKSNWILKKDRFAWKTSDGERENESICETVTTYQTLDLTFKVKLHQKIIPLIGYAYMVNREFVNGLKSTRLLVKKWTTQQQHFLHSKIRTIYRC